MTRFSLSRLPERCFWAGVLFCTVYLSYRYPLQINDSGTSPTYADTPLSLQLSKFIVMLFVCLTALVYIPGKVMAYRRWCLALVAAIMSVCPIIKAGGVEFQSRTAYVDLAVWPLVALVLALSATPIQVSSLNKYFRFVFVYAMATTAVQVSLFLLTGRLPALAYAASFSVRFGGFLDDPNGFAAILFMLMGWAYHRFSGKKRFFAEFALVLCVLLTQSLTAFGFLGLMILVAIVYQFIYRPRRSLVVGLGVAIAAIMAPWDSILSAFAVISEVRSGSIDAHFSQVTATESVTALDWLFGGQRFRPFESWWVSSVVNLGVPWALLSVGVMATLSFAVLRALKHSVSQQEKAVLCAISMLSCYFMIGNLNLPFYTIFPVNFLFFVLSFLVFFKRIKRDALLVTARDHAFHDPAPHPALLKAGLEHRYTRSTDTFKRADAAAPSA